jgi:glycosyltransferase involved in cell wall biosynthesis
MNAKPDNAMRHTRSIAVVCMHAYPLFDPAVKSAIGGMETRAALFARALAQSGRWRVRFVVTDFGQSKRTWQEGIVFDSYQPLHRRASDNVNPRFAKRKWFPILNLDRRDLALLWQIPLLALYRLLPALFFPLFWRRRRADVVCCFGNSGISAQVIADCRRLGIRTVLFIASDDDIAADYRPGNQELNDYNTPKWMPHYALENADRVFVQTADQARLLAERFGRQGEVIRNPVPVTADDPARWPPRQAREFVLWIGRADTFNKRPMLFLELARRCPEQAFLMIANRTHGRDVFSALQAERPPNLTVIERVPHSQIWDYYRRALAFVNTSLYEGFPNTFLQCAVSGVPVVSLNVDPEGIFSRHGCGLLARGATEELERAVRALCADPALAEQYARRFHSYALEHHSLDAQSHAFETLLRKAADGPLSSPRLPWWRLPRRRFVRRTEA